MITILTAEHLIALRWRVPYAFLGWPALAKELSALGAVVYRGLGLHFAGFFLIGLSLSVAAMRWRTT